MNIVFEVVFSITFVVLFGFMAVLRWGIAFPRLGRWIDRKLRSDWFDGPRRSDDND
jgi:hypothetical protein